MAWAALIALPAPATEADQPTPLAGRDVRVAVLAFRGNERAMRRWSATMDYLSQRITGYRFRAIPMNLDQLDRAVAAGSIDFAVTNAGQHVRLGAKEGMSWLATLKSRRHRGRGPVIGSTLLVSADSAYRSLDDLRHTRLGAVSPLAFGGAQIYWGEMAAQGYRPDAFFEETRFSGYPVEALAVWVRDGLVDAAVVPACLLESLVEEGLFTGAEFRVIAPQMHDGFQCQVSSRLYPNWSFSTLKATPPKLAGEVAQALLAMPAESDAARAADSLGWTAPASSYDIHQLYQQLDIHPWQAPWWQDLGRWLRHNWPWGAALLAVIVTGFGHHLWVQLLVRRRTRELEAVNGTLMDQQRQLEHAQRVAILGELASDLAHELNQPLAAINSYSEGGLVRLQRDPGSVDLSGLLGRISGEAQRGGRIIERIRGFVRKQVAPKTRLDLSALIRETLTLLDYELKKQPLQLEVILPERPLLMTLDAIEIQQLLVNLIRNSLDAMAATARPRKLWISCEVIAPGSALLRVEDTGCGIDPDQVEPLFKPFHSTKPQGLGLGLSICRRIVEAHGGDIDIAPSPRGTRVSCRLEDQV